MSSIAASASGSVAVTLPSLTNVEQKAERLQTRTANFLGKNTICCLSKLGHKEGDGFFKTVGKMIALIASFIVLVIPALIVAGAKKVWGSTKAEEVKSAASSIASDVSSAVSSVASVVSSAASSIVSEVSSAASSVASEVSSAASSVASNVETKPHLDDAVPSATASVTASVGSGSATATVTT